MPARSSTCTRAWEPRPDGALRGRLAGTSPSDRSLRTRSPTSGLRWIQGSSPRSTRPCWCLSGRPAADSGLSRSTKRRGEAAPGGLAGTPPEQLPPVLQTAWGKALAEAAGQGSSLLPLFRAGPDCCLRGTAKSLDATRVVATIRRPRALPKPRRSWTSSARWSAAGARTGRSTTATRPMPGSAACPGSR
jgi:hypothetical protein